MTLRFIGVAAIALSAVQPSPAAADTGELEGEVSVAAGWSKNPFLVEDGTGSAFATLGLTSTYRLRSERSESYLNGHFRGTAYARDYRHSIEFGASADHKRQFSENLRVELQALFDRSVVGTGVGLFGVEGSPASPGTTIPETSPADLSSIGTRLRRETFTSSAGLEFRGSAVDVLNLGIFGSRSHYSGSALANSFWSYGANGSYYRMLSETASIGASASAQRVDYSAQGPSYSIFQPRIAFKKKLSAIWSVEVSAGGLLVRGSGPGAVDITGVSAAARLASRGPDPVPASTSARTPLPKEPGEFGSGSPPISFTPSS